MALVEAAELVERIWARDASLWTGSDEARWLGWLDEPLRTLERVPDLLQLAEETAELDHLVLLGMGGSSLAPEVLRRTFDIDRLHVLDSTHPAAVRRLAESLDLESTLFVVASKSGSTLETRCHLDFFWERAGKNGSSFAAVTDPGSELDALARERGFHAVFHGEPTIGGRYSALSVFGMVPAALMGIDVKDLAERAALAVEDCRGLDNNHGLELGLALGSGWRDGRDKVLVVPDPGGFGLWAEQLLAESTGKAGKGLVPVPGESAPGPDRQVAEVLISEGYDLGIEFYRWEFATAVAGAILGINPFDQPNVQEAKDNTARILKEGLPEVEAGSLEELLAKASPPHYISILGYVTPSDEFDAAVTELRAKLRDSTKCTTTFGYGPRYLHSTGQYHKGGPPNGLFIQLFQGAEEDIEIPEAGYSFEYLKSAQALGDMQTLRAHGLDVVRVDVDGPDAVRRLI